MRIAIVSYMGYDGPGVMHAHHFANLLVAAGHDVLFLLNGPRNTVELMADAPRYRLEEVSFHAGTLSSGLRRKVREFSPDLVHIWTPRHLPARVGLEIAVNHGARLIIHFEDDEEFILSHFGGNNRFCRDDLALFRLFVDPKLDAPRLDRRAAELDTGFLRTTTLDPPSWAWLHPIVSAIAIRFADASTVISAAYQKRLMELHGARPTLLLYPGVDHDRFSVGKDGSRLAAELGLRDRRVFLYSGAIADIHDFTALMEAIPAVVADYPEVALVHVGRNDIRDVTERMALERGIEKHVLFMGPVPHHRMPEYLALADVFLAPVRPDDFNAHRLPSKIPEYMAVGRPMIIADHGFGRELDDGTEVQKVESDSSEAIAAAMRRLLERPDRWPEMGKRLREKSRKLFDWPNNTADLIAFYEVVLGSVPADRPEGFDDAEHASTLENIGYAVEGSQDVDARQRSAGTQGKPRVVILTDGRLGKRMSGIGIRYWEIARALSSKCDVALGHRYHADVEGAGFDIFRWDPKDPKPVLDLLGAADVLIVHGYMLEKLPDLTGIDTRIVVDLYCPFVFENLELHREREIPLDERESIHANDLRVLLEQVRTGNYFMCCTERQRSWIVGLLTALNRLRPETIDDQTAIDDIVGLVPFGLPAEPPPRAPENSVLKGEMPGITKDDLVLLWGGGIWSWLDPATLIRAMAHVGRQRNDVKLFFLSTLPAEEDLIEMPVLASTLALAEELGVRDRSVIFNTGGYIEYERRLAYFCEADIGVCAHHSSLENHYAFRTRILDYLYCGLPIITSTGDHFGDLVEKELLGFAIPPGDVDGWVDAIMSLADDEQLRSGCADRSRSLRELYTWPRLTRRLLDYCMDPSRIGLKRAPVGTAATFMPPSRSALSSPSPSTNEPYASDLAARSDEELFSIALREIHTLKTRLSDTREHAAMSDARYKRTLEMLRVVELQLSIIKKIPFAQRIWRLIKKRRYPHLHR